MMLRSGFLWCWGKNSASKEDKTEDEQKFSSALASPSGTYANYSSRDGKIITYLLTSVQQNLVIQIPV